MLLNTALFAANNPHALIHTNKGDIEIELFADKAPKSVANFLRYVDEDFYDDTIFHRVILGFMIQGGGFDADYNKKHTHDGVENEAKNGLKNKRGTLAMARTAAPHSGTAQFFINLENNKFLNYPGQDDWGYAVFGKVVKGMDVVTAIGDERTGAGGPFQQNVPRDSIIIKKISRIPSIQTMEK